MEISNVQFYYLPHNVPGKGDLAAVCSLVVGGDFKVSEVRIVSRHDGKGLLVAVPNRPIKQPCESCGHKVPMKDHYCGNCGVGREPKPFINREGREVWYADVCHAINPEARADLVGAVMEAYRREVAR